MICVTGFSITQTDQELLASCLLTFVFCFVYFMLNPILLAQSSPEHGRASLDAIIATEKVNKKNSEPLLGIRLVAF